MNVGFVTVRTHWTVLPKLWPISDALIVEGNTTCAIAKNLAAIVIRLLTPSLPAANAVLATRGAMLPRIALHLVPSVCPRSTHGSSAENAQIATFGVTNPHLAQIVRNVEMITTCATAPISRKQQLPSFFEEFL